MAKKDNRIIKPTFPNTPIGNLLEQAYSLKYEKIYNYKYTYYTKTPHGMREDSNLNHQYGTDREGYESWKDDNPNLTMSYSGVVTLREIQRRETNETIGYMTEEKLPNKPWIEKIDLLLEDAWKLFCDELGVKDDNAMDYFLFGEIEMDWRDEGSDRIAKFNKMINCIERYNDSDEQDYKMIIDKIKG